MSQADDLTAQRDALRADLDAGRITVWEFNTRNKALIAAQRGEAVVEPIAGRGPSWGQADKGWVGGGPAKAAPSEVEVHPPLRAGAGDGRSFLFLFGLKKAASVDQMMCERELTAIADDVAQLREAGFTVVVDRAAVKTGLIQAVTGAYPGVEGLAPAGVYYSAHGNPDGSIETSDGGLVRPTDLDPAAVHTGLRLFVLGACYVGSRARTWRKALGGRALVVGWGRPVTIDRAVDFLTSRADTETDLDDLVRRHVVGDEPIPPDAETVEEAAWRTGSSDGLMAHLDAVVERLGGSAARVDGRLTVRVPLADGRAHRVSLSLTRSSLPFTEGRMLVAAEAEVGELTGIVEVPTLLARSSVPGLSRVALVKGHADLPVVLVQGFLPYGVGPDDLAGLCLEVAERADRLERTIYGADIG